MTRRAKTREPAPPPAANRGQRFDDAVLRGVFLMLAAVVTMALGYDLSGRLQEEAAMASPRPFLPSVRPGMAPSAPPGGTGVLGEAMTIELVGGGRLLASGQILPGTAAAFAEEIGKRGEYVRTVVLDSPGGSVQDALAMARLVRERGLTTLVESDGHCASSCPLVFAGGVERIAVDGASVGVHQVSSAAGTGLAVPDRARDMADAQRITAECQRLLVDMGVDPRVWIHAMETAPDEIFYFSPAELVDLSLATSTRAPEE